MTNFKCKTCGASLEDLAAKSTNGLVTCPYCGNVWTVPKQDICSEAMQFLRMGEHDLDTGKFDDALAAYKKAAEFEPKEPEAYFGMALAEFKIQFLKDHVNNRVQPICYEVTNKKFTDSNSYLRAVVNATPEQKVEYEKKGAEIDYILGEFYKLKQSGVDYDCFICVKVTDDKTKQVTEDSKDADYIYRLLQDKGYKPFYSERELRNVTGADYEARILYALSASECMLVVCRNEAYLQTPWVKNEYMRFLKLINDEEKENDSITIVFNGAPIEKLPNKNGKIQGINFALREADGKIIDFVDSHTPAAKARKAEAERRKAKEQEETAKRFKELEEQIKNATTSQSFGGATVASLLKRGYRELEDGNFDKANDCFDRVIDADPENAEAYLGKLLAECRIKKRENLSDSNYPLDKYQEYQKACSFGDEKLRKELNAANESIKLKLEEAHNKELYNKGVAEMKSAKHSKSYRKAAAFFATIKGYKDSDALCDKCLKQAKSAKKQEKRRVMIGTLSTAAVAVVIVVVIIAVSVSMANAALKDKNARNGLKIVFSADKSYCIVTGIDEEESNENLSEVIIPDTYKGLPVAKIDGYAFSGYNNLTRVEIPNSVTTIGEGAFEGCNSLTSITIPFVGNGSDKTHFGYLFGASYVPETLKTVIITGGNTICARAFAGCSSLTRVEIPNSVTTIGLSAFEGCNSLTSITIPFVGNGSNETHFGYIFGASAYFENSDYVPSSLKTVKITSGEAVDSYAFQGCGSLTSIEIPDSVTSIGYRAFYGCSSLTSIEIPDSVTTIDEDAFSGCSSLKYTKYNGANYLGNKNNPYLVLISVEDKKIDTLEINNKTQIIYYRAFYGCSSLTSIKIPDGVTSIYYGAFYGCSSLQTVTFGENSILASIGFSAFEGCSSLTSIKIPDSVTYIGSSAFEGCSSLISVVFEELGSWTLMNYTENGFEELMIETSSNSQINATYLTDTYYDYAWWR